MMLSHADFARILEAALHDDIPQDADTWDETKAADFLRSSLPSEPSGRETLHPMQDLPEIQDPGRIELIETFSSRVDAIGNFAVVATLIFGAALGELGSFDLEAFVPGCVAGVNSTC
eukprot:489460-Prymnesium_polylepis.1